MKATRIPPTGTPVAVLKGGEAIFLISTPTEEESRTAHFKQCGWDAKQIAALRRTAWFRVELTLAVVDKKTGLYNGVDTEHLGCCCYHSEEEFYTRYRTDYLADMMRTLAEKAGLKAEVDALIAQWSAA